MFSEFLTRTLTRSGNEPDGCGMSTRPDAFSGRGATTTDLNFRRLEVIYQSVLQNKGEKAAMAYAQMVADIPRLTATDFLITLAALESNNWVWDKRLLGSQNGLYAGDAESAFGTVACVLGGMSEVDQTYWIRRDFLAEHKIKVAKKKGERKFRCDHFGNYFDDDNN